MGTNRLDFGGDPITPSPILPQFFTPSQCPGIRRTAARWHCKGFKSRTYCFHRVLICETATGKMHVLSSFVSCKESLCPGIVSSGNAWERRSQSYFDSENGVPCRNAKPALGELYKMHPVCTKIRLFEIQNRKMFFFWGQTLPQWVR